MYDEDGTSGDGSTTDGEVKVRLPGSCDHTDEYGPLRRCASRHCMVHFTPAMVCRSCNAKTETIKTEWRQG